MNTREERRTHVTLNTLYVSDELLNINWAMYLWIARYFFLNFYQVFGNYGHSNKNMAIYYIRPRQSLECFKSKKTKKNLIDRDTLSS